MGGDYYYASEEEEEEHPEQQQMVYLQEQQEQQQINQLQQDQQQQINQFMDNIEQQPRYVQVLQNCSQQGYASQPKDCTFCGESIWLDNNQGSILKYHQCFHAIKDTDYGQEEVVVDSEQFIYVLDGICRDRIMECAPEYGQRKCQMCNEQEMEFMEIEFIVQDDCPLCKTKVRRLAQEWLFHFNQFHPSVFDESCKVCKWKPTADDGVKRLFQTVDLLKHVKDEGVGQLVKLFRGYDQKQQHICQWKLALQGTNKYKYYDQSQLTNMLDEMEI